MRFKEVMILIVLIKISNFIKSQQVDIQVVYNNTSDILKNSEMIEKIKSSVKISELREALNINGHITDKNLVIRITFFDKGVIGQLKLKNEHELTADGYIERWQEMVKGRSGVLFLFVKGKGNSQYTFYKMVVSKQLEKEHLFPLVIEFINENLKGEILDIIGNGTRYLAKAIIPVWDVDPNDNRGIKKEAENLTRHEKYWANRINFFHNTWKSTFLDLMPMKYEIRRIKVYFKSNNDTIKPKINIYADTNFFKGGTTLEIEGEEYSFSFLCEIFTRLNEKEKERILLIEPKSTNTQHESYIIPLISALERERKYSDKMYVSEWAWEKSDKPISFKIISYEGLRDYNENDKFELIKRNMNTEYKEGDPLPVIHPWYPITYCNVFASDMSRAILFKSIFTTGDNYAPWGRHESASKIHERIMKNENKHFKSVSLQEAWEYTNAGYVVYLTAYNWRYYEGKTTNPHAYSGHIATCFPTKGYNGDYLSANVIQAGIGEANIKQFRSCFNRKIINNVSANLYLGYILK